MLVQLAVVWGQKPRRTGTSPAVRDGADYAGVRRARPAQLGLVANECVVAVGSFYKKRTGFGAARCCLAPLACQRVPWSEGNFEASL